MAVDAEAEAIALVAAGLFVAIVIVVCGGFVEACLDRTPPAR